MEVSAEALARDLGEHRLRLIAYSDGVCADAREPAGEKRHLRRKTGTYHEYVEYIHLCQFHVDLLDDAFDAALHDFGVFVTQDDKALAFVSSRWRLA